ncbi:GNAT family N-acetyltransferase [Mongoliitalea daihaiensis]|uniref:GNAT family N-acetyltransferase n=1 Tax=Mongoliitalea daihaiensis TaxID=2782006 RepID=UPI001F1EDDF4|nr:GNAT family N-acetyltransferase [Mongoliitalea daihaiensis]UJP64160.1 GNAT family N-acetyltransferase [Mongoliitalea daihaiensis]
MEFRRAIETDIPAIVEVLRQSLGEGLMPKSEELWTWKHLANPFGPSPVLLACESERIVGVRAFMPWQWRLEQQTYQAVRAVDTAVLPAYQGKGIFSRLTAQLVQECTDSKVDFIFNTPNKQSMPGYLKLGWEHVGRIPVSLQLQLNVRKKDGSIASDWKLLHSMDFSELPDTSYWTTPSKANYFSWRYEHCPIAQYECISDGKQYWCIYRMKKQAGLREFRIVELGIPASSGAAEELKNQLKQAISIEGAQLLTASQMHGKTLQAIGWGSFFQIKGPQLTVRKLSSTLPKQLNQIQSWSQCLGALEVF